MHTIGLFLQCLPMLFQRSDQVKFRTIQQGPDLLQWKIQFFMEPQYTLQSLPKPKDDRVKLREIPGYDAVAIRFSGSWEEEHMREQQTALEAYLQQQKLRTTGEPIFAYYNHPFTPWFLKRNEVIYRLATPYAGR